MPREGCTLALSFSLVKFTMGRRNLESRSSSIGTYARSYACMDSWVGWRDNLMQTQFFNGYSAQSQTHLPHGEVGERNAQ